MYGRSESFSHCLVPKTLPNIWKHAYRTSPLLKHDSGLGNLRQNTLPVCQLRRAQRIVNSLYINSRQPVPFWINTVCVPLKYPYRGIATKSMRRTYKEADKILVLDSAIVGTSSQALSATEMAVRLKASSWVRRLGTFHEAYLARDLYYQFLDVALRLSDIREKYHQQSECKFKVNSMHSPEGEV